MFRFCRIELVKKVNPKILFFITLQINSLQTCWRPYIDFKRSWVVSKWSTEDNLLQPVKMFKIFLNATIIESFNYFLELSLIDENCNLHRTKGFQIVRRCEEFVLNFSYIILHNQSLNILPSKSILHWSTT